MKPAQPNLLLIITDEQPVAALSCYGNAAPRTAHLDAMAGAGTRFTRAYTPSPLCTPARAALFTGMVPTKTGAWCNDLAIAQEIKTLGHYMKAQGYRTGYIGKWHLDGLDYFGNGECPEEWDPEYWYDGRNHLDYLGEEDGRFWRTFLDQTPEAIKERVTRDFTWGGQITNRAVTFLEAQESANEPWCLVVSYDEPHGPWACPDEYIQRYANFAVALPETWGTDHRDKPAVQKEYARHQTAGGAMNEKIARYTFACTEFVDDEIGKVLEAAGQHENTIRFFTSDHGSQMGAHHLSFKGPWMYEESTKVPLIVNGAGVRAGHVAGEVVSLIDILPTLLDLSGSGEPADAHDGRSFAPLFLEEPAPYEHDNATLIMYNRHSANADRWGGFFPIRCLVRDHMKLSVNLFDTDELYDLAKDPREETNLIEVASYAPIRDALMGELIERLQVIRDPFRCPEWEKRPWYRNRTLSLCQGPVVEKAWDGLGPKARDYNTGQE